MKINNKYLIVFVLNWMNFVQDVKVNGMCSMQRNEEYSNWFWTDLEINDVKQVNNNTIANMWIVYKWFVDPSIDGGWLLEIHKQNYF